MAAKPTAPPPDEDADVASPPPTVTAPPTAAAPGGVPTEPVAEPEKGRPVVLATEFGSEFVVPADVNDKGEPTGDPIHLTPAGVALSKTDAKRVTEAARRSGVTLIEKES